MRLLIWSSSVAALAVVLLLVAVRGPAAGDLRSLSPVDTLVLLASFVVIAALLGVFVRRSFDDEGRWRGRWF